MYNYNNLTMNVIACCPRHACAVVYIMNFRACVCLSSSWFPYTTTREWLFKMVVEVLALLCLFAGASYRSVNMHVFLYVLKP